jgi:signal transduction histidine kinase
VDRAGIVERIRGGLAPHHAGRAGPNCGPREPQPQTRWSWAADAILAVFLSASTANAAGRSMSVVAESVFVSGGPVAPAPPRPPEVRTFAQFTTTSLPVWLVVLAALTALPLVVRRRCPLAAYWAVLGMTLAYHFAARSHSRVDDTAVFTFVACLIAAYSAAIHSPYRRATARSLIVGAGLMLVFHADNVPSVTPSFVPFALLIPGALAANTVHTWRQRVRTLEAEQEMATARAVERERARIARELHDVVTHNVSMMTVQAGAARKVMPRSPELAEQALLAVEAAGRAAMSELRHVMGLLTMSSSVAGASDPPSLSAPAYPGGPDCPDDPTAAELAPQPGLGQLGVLAGRIRDTGVPVELVVSGTPVPLPPGVDLAGYRVVQEALTNTVKHAAGAAVTITVDHRVYELRIEVADTGGTRAAAMAAGNGRGLIGLRERLAVYGGTLDAGRRISGGYRVRAVIPVGDA